MKGIHCRVPFYIFVFIFFNPCTWANIKPQKSPESILSNLKDITGQYQGEVRLQSADGTVNQTIIDSTQLNLSISGDELVIKANSDFLGRKCRSKFLSIRELIELPPNQPEVLKAVFDFDPGTCSKNSESNAILVLLRREGSQNYTLETLLVSNRDGLEIRNQLNRKRLVHGYFTKDNSNPIVSKN